MFEQAFKNIDDVLRKEAGCTTELDYTEQTSWLLFLKYLDGLEQDLADQAALDGKKYTAKLDNLREEAQSLESIYQRKLAALESLKKSLLHQAFTRQTLETRTPQDGPLDDGGN